jgi:hypothetical protein
MEAELRAIAALADEVDRHSWYGNIARRDMEDAIRRAHAAGASLRAIGAAANLSAATIHRILNKENPT